MKKYGWRCIDVSYMAVEEVAVQVLQSIGEVKLALTLGELRAFAGTVQAVLLAFFHARVTRQRACIAQRREGRPCRD